MIPTNIFSVVFLVILLNVFKVIATENQHNPGEITKLSRPNPLQNVLFNEIQVNESKNINHAENALSRVKRQARRNRHPIPIIVGGIGIEPRGFGGRGFGGRGFRGNGFGSRGVGGRGIGGRGIGGRGGFGGGRGGRG